LNTITIGILDSTDPGISNKFAALGDFGTELDINSAWETIREYRNILAKEMMLRIIRSEETSQAAVVTGFK
jgi:hypothetical protein